MRVVWISDSAPAGFTTDAGYFEHHRQASLRFRVGIPARALAALGVETGFIGLDTPAVLEHLAADRVDAIVFAKLSTSRGPSYDAFVTAYLGTADHARQRGLAVVVDLVDNVFATDRRDFFLELLARADAITVSSGALAEVCRQHCRLPVHVVADPAEGERALPRFAPPRASMLSRLGLRRNPEERVRLLWFGGQYRSFLDLTRAFPQLMALARTQPLELAVVTSPDERIARELASLNAQSGATMTARFAEWSLPAMVEALDRCDLVLLPADLHDEMRATASANRLIRALWAGRAVFAQPLPSYLEFRDAAVLDSDPIAAIGRAVARPALILERIRAGQAIIAERYSPAAVGQRWREILVSAS